MTTPNVTPPTFPVFKVVLVGAAGAGKTTLLANYLYDLATPSYIPTPRGLDFHTVTTSIDQITAKVIFWEIASTKVAHDLARAYFSDAYVVLAVIDMRDPQQISLIERFRYDLVNNSRHNARLVLVGTHPDVKEAKSLKESDLKALAERWQCDVHCLNATDNLAVKDLFKKVKASLLQKYTESPEQKKETLTFLQKTVVAPPKVEFQKPKIVPSAAVKSKPRALGFLLSGMMLSLLLLVSITTFQWWPLLTITLLEKIAIPGKIAALFIPVSVALIGFAVGASLHLSALFVKNKLVKKPVVQAKASEKKNTKTIQFRLNDGSILKREQKIQPKLKVIEKALSAEVITKENILAETDETKLFVPLNPFHPF